MVVKNCCYGICNNSNRHYKNPEKYPNIIGVTFHPFVKPKRQLEICRKWIKACGRPHQQLNVEILASKRGKDIYICSEHFVGKKGPTDEYPNPIPVYSLGSSAITSTPKKARKPPTSRDHLPFGNKSNTSPLPSTSSMEIGHDHIYTNVQAKNATNITFDLTLNEPVTINEPVSINEPVIIGENLIHEFSDMDITSLSNMVILSDACTQTDP